MSKSALISGVAGGIGRATARIFSDAGWRVIGVDRADVEGLDGVDRFFNTDVSDASAVGELFRRLRDEETELDALINNAAVQICKPILETTPEEWDDLMASNIRSVFLAVREAYALMQRRGGAIVNVSSVHAVATSANIAAYAASKGALLAFTRALAIELGPDNIRVNAVLPGAVDTPMLRAGLDRGHVSGDDPRELVRALGAKHVLGRVGRTEEIAQAIFFLANDELSSFVAGQALIVDGGATAKLSTE